MQRFNKPPRIVGQVALEDTDSRATIEMRAPRNTFSFANLRIPLKLGLIVLLLTLPLVYFLYQSLQTQNTAVKTLTTEAKGATALKDLVRLFELLGQHRGTSTLARATDQSMNVVSSQGDQISSEIERLIEVNQKNNNEFGVAELFNNLKTDWLAIRKQIPAMTPNVSFQRQSDLIENRFLVIMNRISQASGLILEPQLDAYLIQNLIGTQLPAAIEGLSQLRGFGTSLLTQGKATTAERSLAAAYLDRSKQSVNSVNRAAEDIALARPEFGVDLKARMESVKSFANLALRVGQFDVVDSNNLNQSASTTKGYFDTISKSLNAYFDLYRFNASALERILSQRTLDLQRSGLTNLLLLVTSFLIALLLTGLVVNSITAPLGDMNKVVQKFGSGDLSELIPVRSRDELGNLAGSFNNSILQLRDFLARQEEERVRSAQLQNNIGEFLNVAMDISGGDLTKKGRVSEDVLGNVVDAINLLTEEIGYLLKDVKNTTDKVNSGATDVTNVSKSIAESAVSQTEIAQQAQKQTLEVTTTMRQMSDSAQDASLAASQALSASQAGQLAVSNTLEGMQSIRREVQSISKGIKSLSDRSLEISEIVETISGIAAQTNLLALNAAIEASGAGDAGSRFAIVADEVRKLAEDSARATGRVANLIKGIQTEIQAAVVGVETGTKEVEEGYRIATQAGERLSEIAQLTNQSAAFASTIASNTRIQVHQINNVAQAVQVMAGTAEKTATDSRTGQDAAETLLKLSQQLAQSLTRFQLPS